MITWFEIPVENMQRAIKFYEKVFALDITLQQLDGIEMGWFPNNNQPGVATGTLIKAGQHYSPSQEGVLIYFTCQDVAKEIGRVEDAGGKVISGKTQISENHGYMAYFIDSEGNRIALHSQQ